MTEGLSGAGFDLDLQEGQIKEELLKQLIGGVGYRVEVKWDRRAKDTGNVFIEYRQKGRPSGIAITEADWWAIFFDEDAAVWLRTQRLLWLARESWNAGNRVAGGDYDRYEGVLIPLADLVRIDYLHPATQQELDQRFSQRMSEDPGNLGDSLMDKVFTNRGRAA